MDVTAFAKKIKEDNRTDRSECILMFIVFISSLLVANQYNLDNSSFLGLGLLAVTALIVFLYAVNFYKQYLKISSSGLTDTTGTGNLYDIARTNAFPVNEYFAYIRKKLLIWQGIILVCLIIVGIFYKSVLYLAGSIVLAVIPFIVGFFMQKRFEHRISHRIGVGSMALSGFLGVLRWLAELILAVVYIFIPVLLLWAIISDGLAKGLNDNEIIYRSYGFTAVTMITIVAIMLFLVSCIFYLGKKTALKRIILGIAVILLCTVELILEQNSYTDILPDGITVVTLNGKNEYTLDEIDCYEIYEEDESIQVQVTFKDGEAVTLFSGVSTSTEAYENAYYSEYNFVADLIIALKEHGVSGKLRDIDKLRDAVDGLDEELSVGLEKIIEFMENENP